ncbi:soluble P-type ATPase [Enterococcus sp. PF1-24]|uniref:DUF1659 domain-containing protein n=1 Tax=unclassified Enterococcus TaxID=2608891 RepID=UPI0024765680|nr:MULTISPECIES: hypothetical protein [unclassified Enterococcus]MDH6365641.1 soluble P-type ATPase [Enterococcus sp. PFB1-1]MDH6402742.1 soluble P-type ATPase [Enterococcus sp. PF1-24]
MHLLESTKITVEMLKAGEEKPTKQSFSNVIDNVTEEKILALGDIITDLAPAATQFDSAVKTETTRYVKED